MNAPRTDSDARKSTIARERIFSLFNCNNGYMKAAHDTLYIHYQTCYILVYPHCTGKYYKMVKFSWGLCYIIMS